MLELYSHPPRLSRAAFLNSSFSFFWSNSPDLFLGTLRSLFELSFGLIVCDSSFLVEFATSTPLFEHYHPARLQVQFEVYPLRMSATIPLSNKRPPSWRYTLALSTLM